MVATVSGSLIINILVCPDVPTDTIMNNSHHRYPGTQD